MRIIASKLTFALLISTSLSGCGLRTPEFQEFWGTPNDADTKVRLVVRQVACELRRAFRLIESQDIKLSKEVPQPRTVQFLEDWLVDAAFILTIDEKTTFSPGVTLTDPMRNATTFVAANSIAASTISSPQSYNFGIGGQFSSEALRQEKFHVPWKVSALVGPEKDLPRPEQIQQEACTMSNADASLFLESDFKIEEWLKRIRNLQDREQADFTAPDSFATTGASTEDIKFEIVSSGNLAPVWKLVRVSSGGSTPLFNTSRDRTQEVIITIGPSGKGADKGNLTGSGQNSALSSEIAAGVARGVRDAFTFPF